MHPHSTEPQPQRPVLRAFVKRPPQSLPPALALVASSAGRATSSLHTPRTMCVHQKSETHKPRTYAARAILAEHGSDQPRQFFRIPPPHSSPPTTTMASSPLRPRPQLFRQQLHQRWNWTPPPTAAAQPWPQSVSPLHPSAAKKESSR